MTSPLPPHRPVAVPAPPPSRSGLWTGVVIGLVVAAVLAACAVPAFGFYVWMYLGPDIDEPKAAAARYVELIEAGDDAGAYASLCPDARRELTPEAFTALVSAGPRPVSHAVTGGWFQNEAGKSAGVDVRLTDRTGAAREISLHLDDEDGRWQVCDDPFI